MDKITLDDTIFADYLQYRAGQSGQTVVELSKHINRDEFYETVYALHERFMAGEFSLGYMAQLLGITKPDLYHLLDAMELKVTNV
ncbi:MAG TPA: hypothetical protein VHO69_03070 [Phototrophicaceae bacterium]|nr:hypothetical protein [Phototrophicaceae bacterium]